MDEPCENTDRELWRETEGDYYSPSIFVTKDGAIGINVGGYCIVNSVEGWHGMAPRLTVEKQPAGLKEPKG